MPWMGDPAARGFAECVDGLIANSTSARREVRGDLANRDRGEGQLLAAEVTPARPALRPRKVKLVARGPSLRTGESAAPPPYSGREPNQVNRNSANWLGMSNKQCVEAFLALEDLAEQSGFQAPSVAEHGVAERTHGIGPVLPRHPMLSPGTIQRCKTGSLGPLTKMKRRRAGLLRTDFESVEEAHLRGPCFGRHAGASPTDQ